MAALHAGQDLPQQKRCIGIVERVVLGVSVARLAGVDEHADRDGHLAAVDQVVEHHARPDLPLRDRDTSSCPERPSATPATIRRSTQARRTQYDRVGAREGLAGAQLVPVDRSAEERLAGRTRRDRAAIIVSGCRKVDRPGARTGSRPRGQLSRDGGTQDERGRAAIHLPPDDDAREGRSAFESGMNRRYWGGRRDAPITVAEHDRTFVVPPDVYAPHPLGLAAIVPDEVRDGDRVLDMDTAAASTASWPHRDPRDILAVDVEPGGRRLRERQR